MTVTTDRFSGTPSQGITNNFAPIGGTDGEYFGAQYFASGYFGAGYFLRGAPSSIADTTDRFSGTSVSTATDRY
jgi:hypothetical protein